MKRTTYHLIPVVAAGLILTAGTVAAQVRGAGSGAPGRHWGVERTTAVAALEPLGAVEGWGRVMIMDLATEDDVERRASVRLIGLEPEAEYTLTVDGVTLAAVLTDTEGDGFVHLGSGDEATGPVPEDVPAAADAMLATVLDASMAPTLEGSFEIVTHGGVGFGGLVHVERIILESDDPAVTRGIARVARDLDDIQYFESRACGLISGESYQITVDGHVAGIVTADPVGQGSIFLATDGEADPLPSDLQPIEDLRQVEWTTSSGDVILWGAFTGESMAGYGGNQGGGAGGSHGGDNGHNGGDNGGDNGGGNGGGNGGDNGGGNGGDNGGGNGGDNGGGNGGDNGGGNGGDNGGGDGGGDGGGNGGGNGGGCP